jgi:outer membrane protein OmpA-like peptidoglycan-associated protein
MKPIYYNLLGAVLISSLNFAQPVMANQGNAYEFDGTGQPVRSGDGNCVHTGSWNASMPTCPEPTMVLEESQGKIVFALDDSEFFGFDQVKLSKPAKDDLNALVSAVKDADMIHGITITGHADQIGPAPYNENLALTRAESVKNYLVSKGIPAERIQALTDGTSEPLVSCQNISNKTKLIHCLAPNRRVDIEALLGDDVEIDTVMLTPSGQ